VEVARHEHPGEKCEIAPVLIEAESIYEYLTSLMVLEDVHETRDGRCNKVDISVSFVVASVSTPYTYLTGPSGRGS